MKMHLSALGCLTFLLLGSQEAYASDFTLNDPNGRSNVSLDCNAVRYINSQPQQSGTFNLRLDVNFAERSAIISSEVGRDKISMALTGIATAPDQESEYIVFTNGSASAIVNTQSRDVLVVKTTVIGFEDYSIFGQSCKTTLAY